MISVKKFVSILILLIMSFNFMGCSCSNTKLKIEGFEEKEENVLFPCLYQSEYFYHFLDTSGS